jgi:hypothetical protein
MTPSKCRSCGREIVWAETQHGAKVPLDPKALVFSVLEVGNKLIAVKPGGLHGERWLVSHFATCKDANAWSGHKPGDPMPEKHFSEPKEISGDPFTSMGPEED